MSDLIFGRQVTNAEEEEHRKVLIIPTGSIVAGYCCTVLLTGMHCFVHQVWNTELGT
jgi:hypothetical protein